MSKPKKKGFGFRRGKLDRGTKETLISVYDDAIDWENTPFEEGEYLAGRDELVKELVFFEGVQPSPLLFHFPSQAELLFAAGKAGIDLDVAAEGDDQVQLAGALRPLPSKTGEQLAIATFWTELGRVCLDSCLDKEVLDLHKETVYARVRRVTDSCLDAHGEGLELMCSEVGQYLDMRGRLGKPLRRVSESASSGETQGESTDTPTTAESAETRSTENGGDVTDPESQTASLDEDAPTKSVETPSSSAPSPSQETPTSPPSSTPTTTGNKDTSPPQDQ